MSSTLPILMDTLLRASKADEALQCSVHAHAQELVGQHVPDIVILLRLTADLLINTDIDRHDSRQEAKPRFKTSRLVDELLHRFCLTWASNEVRQGLHELTALDKSLSRVLQEITPQVAQTRFTEAGAFSVLAQAERLKRGDTSGLDRFENGLKSSTSKTRELFFPSDPSEPSIWRQGSLMGEIGIRFEEEKAQSGALSNSVLISELMSNLAICRLLDYIEHPVYGTKSILFYLPAIADRLINPCGPTLSLEYCQLYQKTIKRTLDTLSVLRATCQASSDEPSGP